MEFHEISRACNHDVGGTEPIPRELMQREVPGFLPQEPTLFLRARGSYALEGGHDEEWYPVHRGPQGTQCFERCTYQPWGERTSPNLVLSIEKNTVVSSPRSGATPPLVTRKNRDGNAHLVPRATASERSVRTWRGGAPIAPPPGGRQIPRHSPTKIEAT